MLDFSQLLLLKQLSQAKHFQHLLAVYSYRFLMNLEEVLRSHIIASSPLWTQVSRFTLYLDAFDNLQSACDRPSLSDFSSMLPEWERIALLRFLMPEHLDQLPQKDGVVCTVRTTHIQATKYHFCCCMVSLHIALVKGSMVCQRLCAPCLLFNSVLLPLLNRRF